MEVAAPAWHPSPTRQLALTALAMLAFAGNSLLCRLALKHSAIDAASFTSVRLVAGALTLALILRLRTPGGGAASQGDWLSAAALFVYAAGFSWAYVSLPAASGALLLFAAVQVTMIGWGLWRGERLRPLQTVGLLAACAGLLALLLPAAGEAASGAQPPALRGSLLMLCAGAAWGVYSLRGRGAGDPLGVTGGNFWRAAALSLVMSMLMMQSARFDAAGVAYALASGALASGVGYAVWYSALRGMSATGAASVQLTVPVIAAAGAVVLLGEGVTLRLLLCAVVILGGVALVIARRRPAAAATVNKAATRRI